MTSKEIQHLLLSAEHELEAIRRHHEILTAKEQVFDGMMLLFTSQPNFQRGGAAPDVVWELRRMRVALENEELEKGEPSNV